MHYNNKETNKYTLNKAFSICIDSLIHSSAAARANANAAEILIEAISKRIENGATNDGNEMNGAIGGQSSVVKICTRTYCSLIN
jgi:hypothetical protein